MHQRNEQPRKSCVTHGKWKQEKFYQHPLLISGAMHAHTSIHNSLAYLRRISCIANSARQFFGISIALCLSWIVPSHLIVVSARTGGGGNNHMHSWLINMTNDQNCVQQWWSAIASQPWMAKSHSPSRKWTSCTFTARLIDCWLRWRNLAERRRNGGIVENDYREHCAT